MVKCITCTSFNASDDTTTVEGGLPARVLYEEVFPTVVSRLTHDEIPYHRGSPYGGKGWDTADPTIGDVHYWHVWAGTQVYHDYDILGGRFVR